MTECTTYFSLSFDILVGARCIFKIFSIHRYGYSTEYRYRVRIWIYLHLIFVMNHDTIQQSFHYLVAKREYLMCTYNCSTQYVVCIYNFRRIETNTGETRKLMANFISISTGFIVLYRECCVDVKCDVCLSSGCSLRCKMSDSPLVCTVPPTRSIEMCCVLSTDRNLK